MSGGERLRVSQHSGRSGSAKHNDRSFMNGRSAEWREEHAPHIDMTRTNGNILWTWNGTEDMETSEREWYSETYRDALERTNERYRHEGHADRCKTPDDLYKGRLTRPEEMILQVGKHVDDIDPAQLKAAVDRYIDALDAWNEAHGGHMHILSIALHADETSPHVHIRRVWDYTDRDGLTRLGQAKALEAAGVPLPDHGKSVGRYNNRKMSFDAMARGWWQECCRAQGWEIETEARPDMRHKDKAEYVYGQIAAEIDTVTAQADRSRQEAAQADQIRQEATRQAEAARMELEAIEERTRALTAAEVERMAQSHRGFLGLRLVRSDDWERVISTAKTAEDATRRADAIEQERDGILRQAREQAQELTQQATRERDAALQERDRARQQRDGLRKERDDLQRDVQEWIDRASDDRGVYLTGYLATERMASKLVAIMEYQDARQLMQIDRLMDDCIRQMPDYMRDELLRDIREQDNALEEHKRAVKDLSDDLEL